MAQFPCLPLWTDAWKADTDHLTRFERGTYLDLLVLMWRTPSCRVPNDNAWLAKHLRLTSREIVEEVRPIIGEFCRTDGNWITQKRLLKEYERSAGYRQRLSDLRKRRKSKQNDANTTRSTSDVGSLHTSHLSKESSFPTATRATPNAGEKSDQQSPRSLATALPTGALAHSAETKPQEPKQSSEKNPEEMTLTEINQRWRGAG
jgi:uncharacterized protein YdaU (DUF1376 family)